MTEDETSQSDEEDAGFGWSVPVPWGIYVVSAFWGLVAIAVPALLLLLPAITGKPIGAGGWLVLIITPLSLLFCIGMALRINWIRLVLAALLGVSLISDSILVAFIVAFGAFHRLAPAAVRVAITIAMVQYLLSRPVRQAFVRNQNGDAPGGQR
jgi:hypothetical protein